MSNISSYLSYFERLISMICDNRFRIIKHFLCSTHRFLWLKCIAIEISCIFFAICFLIIANIVKGFFNCLFIIFYIVNGIIQTISYRPNCSYCFNHPLTFSSKFLIIFLNSSIVTSTINDDLSCLLFKDLAI